MANPVNEIHVFACTVPAGTTQNNPAVFPATMPMMVVEWVEVIVPPGPRGAVGFWIGSHGQPIIPATVGSPTWIVTDDEKSHWDLTGQMDSGDWQVQAYNTGIDAHTITVRFGLTKTPGAGLVAPLPLGALSSG